MVQPPPDKSHLVRCERHGVYYNPATSSECAICRSSAEADREPAGFRFSPFKIVGTLVFVIGAFFLIGRMTRSVGERGAVVSERVAEEARLDPADYRQELERIEALVYAADPRPFDHGAAIFREASALSAKIVQSGGGMLEQARNAQYGLEITSFGQRQAVSDDVGYAVFDLSRAQSDWEQVRAQVFQHADWLHAATNRGTGPTASPDAPAMAPGTVRLLRDLATGLENASRFGRQQAMRVGEMTGDPRSAESRRTLEAWESFRRSMTTSLQATVSRLPSDARLLDNDARTAHQYLDQAANRLASLVRYDRPPPRSSRQDAFDSVDRNIGQAKALLARLPD